MWSELLKFGIGFMVIWAIFLVVETAFAAIREKKVFRRGFRMDLGHFALARIVTDPIGRICSVALLVPFALLVTGSPDPRPLIDGYGPIGALPLWAQTIILLVLADFLGYWLHRWFHGKTLWPLHAIHHSSDELDWLSSIRDHPLNQLIVKLYRVLFFALIGFSLKAIAILLPILLLHAVVLHANVNWTYGPFKKVIVSPVYHRWHHTVDPEAMNTNFSTILPLWDILFGTYYMPEGRLPQRFGLDEDIGQTLMEQLVYPFKVWRKS